MIKRLILLTLLLCSTAVAEDYLSRSGDDIRLTAPNDGDLIIGTLGAGNIKICTNQSGTAACRALDAETSSFETDYIVNSTAGNQYLKMSVDDTNVLVGKDAGTSITTAVGSVVVGDSAGAAITSEDGNTCVGNATCNALTATNAVCVGSGACNNSTTSASSVAVGKGALGTGITAGNNNIAIGLNAGAAITSAASNLLAGTNAGAAMLTGGFNTCLGDSACIAHAGANPVVAIGSAALSTATNPGDGTVVIGEGALATGLLTGANDIVIGRKAGLNLTTAANTICIGGEACVENTTQGGGVYIGHNVGKSALTPAANILAIDNNDDATPLISGNFGTHVVTFNGATSTTGDASLTAGNLVIEADNKGLIMDADDQALTICSGSTCNRATGAWLELDGATAGGAGGMTFNTGASVGNGDLNINLGDDASEFRITNVAINGSRMNYHTGEETLSALSGATATTSGLVPAGSVLMAVTAYVTTLITGATSFEVGDGTDVNRFGGTIAVAAGTKVTTTDATADPTGWASGAQEVTLTANGSNFTAGAVRVIAYYKTFTAPTS